MIWCRLQLQRAHPRVYINTLPITCARKPNAYLHLLPDRKWNRCRGGLLKNQNGLYKSFTLKYPVPSPTFCFILLPAENIDGALSRVYVKQRLPAAPSTLRCFKKEGCFFCCKHLRKVYTKGFLRNWGLVNRKDSFSEPFRRFKNLFRKCRACSESLHQI